MSSPNGKKEEVEPPKLVLVANALSDETQRPGKQWAKEGKEEMEGEIENLGIGDYN
jgi:hypothetical protein